MAIEYFNPKWFFRDTLTTEHQQKIEEIFSNFISDQQNFSAPPKWADFCKVKVSSLIDQPDLRDEYLKIINTIFDRFLYEMKPKYNVDIACEGLWINKYHPGDFQEFHNHSMPSCNLSMVYILKDDETNKFKFFDPDWQLNRANGLNDTLELPNFEVYTPNLHQGDIILFPSQYGHYVTPNTSSDERITISGNFRVERLWETLNAVKLF